MTGGAGPLKYSPSLLVPTAALLSTFGAVYGSTWILAILGVIPSQVWVCESCIFAMPQIVPQHQHSWDCSQAWKL